MPTLTDAQKESFISDGYVILPSIVPIELIEAAETEVDEALARSAQLTQEQSEADHQDGNNNVPTFYHTRRSPTILSLYFDTLLKDAVIDLLGNEDQLRIRDDAAQVACTSPGNTRLEINEQPSKDQWHVDASHGTYSSIAADFLLLAGVALSDGQHVDENRGQLVVFPSSHHKTHSKLQQLIKDTKNVAQVMQRFRTENIDVGLPKRVLLNRGDAVIAHQRLAHVAGFNCHPTLTRKNIYFRIERQDFPSYAHSYVTAPHPWTSFSGLSTNLPDESMTHVPAIENMKPVSALLSAHKLHNRQNLQLTSEQQLNFMNDGFIILGNVVDGELLRKGLKKVHTALNNGKIKRNHKGHIMFNTHVGCGLALTDVLLKSGIINYVEHLLGAENSVLLNSKAEIVVREFQNNTTDDDCDPNELIRKGGWEIDIGKGRFWRRGMDHMIRVIVPLTDEMDVNENRGQLVVWPGSHNPTHCMMKDIINDFEKEDRGKAYRDAKRKLKLADNRKRLLMKKGDIAIIHQRLATTISENVACENSSVMLQFPLQSADFADILDDFQNCSHPFFGFQALSDLI